ncbi:MAG: hypothetical protein B6D56_04855 [Candidatus Omnitrophica bacterium 4484_70.1]|nr:MAG: hypothetical protein B6D56_04855 [Candidatus Omnitrophica bacterium 4484_70.1]
MQTYKGEERRKYPRAKISFIVSYRIKHPEESYDLSQTKDASQGGMLLTTNREFEKGTYLEMIIRFPFVPYKIRLLGEVVDSKKVVTNLIYETRIRFVGPHKNFFKELGEFIKEKLKKEKNG